jgi:hypothetical protein
MKLLRSNDDTETGAEHEADERAVNDDTTVQPTFTPTDEIADDPAVTDADDAAVTPTLVEPAAEYGDDTTAEPASDYQGLHAVAEPVVDSGDDDVVTDEDDAVTDEPVASYTAVETVEADEPVDDYADSGDEPATVYDETPVTDEPATVYDGTPVTADSPVVADVEPVTATPVTATPVASTAAATPAAAPSLDQPLLSGDTELLAQWQRVQAEFVDDPQVAVAGAADLVEQAGQALVDALQQRQRQMRTLWDHSAANGSGTPDGGPADGTSDTEQLRLMMQRYRALFNQLYQPV